MVFSICKLCVWCIQVFSVFALADSVFIFLIYYTYRDLDTDIKFIAAAAASAFCYEKKIVRKHKSE